MNDLSHAIRNFNRFELKYVITLKQAAQFRESLKAFLIPDEHGSNNGHYIVNSLYYDSPDLHCYHEKEDGIHFRRKLRMRRYETDEIFSDETPVFLEIKQRVDRVTQKRRVVLPYRDALRLTNDRQIPDHAQENRATIEEIYAFLWQYNLRPTSLVRYHRQAFIGTRYDIGLRVTFDTSLSFQVHPLHLHEQPCGLQLLSPHLVVMEIKVNERIPTWLTDLIAAHDLQMVRISKYGRSISAAQEIPALQGRSSSPESSQQVLASCLSVFNQMEKRFSINNI